MKSHFIFGHSLRYFVHDNIIDDDDDDDDDDDEIFCFRSKKCFFGEVHNFIILT